jgi:predicted DNA-binding transcriptional regulator YafY
MNRFDRILGILLLLRSGKSMSASDLARQFEVSLRTIYRDMDTLSSLGVPVYAERGREGGFRLLEGYFLPPLMFSTSEAISLLLGLMMMRSLRVRPFSTESDAAEKKLLAAVPDHLRAVLAAAQKIVGFETVSEDAFHREVAVLPPTIAPGQARQGEIVQVFLQAILERNLVHMQYHSPYQHKTDAVMAEPCGVFWDRDLWYLAGRRTDRHRAQRLWRADRVLAIEPRDTHTELASDFDVRQLLGRRWLGEAMAQWAQETPVRIRLSRAQAERLQRDWYYQHAHFELESDDRAILSFGQDVREVVLELMRWLGPDAELLEPKAWRRSLASELRAMLVRHADDDCETTPKE